MHPTLLRAAMFAGGIAWLTPAALPGDVVINEFVASASERMLFREPGQFPRVGLAIAWQDPAFDDSLWDEGPGPFGFGTLSGVAAATDTSAAMQGRVPSLYLRQRFTATAGQAASTARLRLAVRCNDGFIAFLNGREVARRNLGPAGTFVFHDQPAFNADRSAAEVTIDLGPASALLASGENVLCIQAHNTMAESVDASTFLIRASLEIAGTPAAVLAAADGPWRFFVGVTEPSGGVVDHGLLRLQPARVLWASPEYNDLTWRQGPGPVGYDTASQPDYVPGTDLRASMYSATTSVYTRLAFTATEAEAAAADPLSLVLDYDDGIVVYLNGIEVARRNLGAPGTVTPHTASATVDHEANAEGTTGREETLLLPAASSLLLPGDNILAVQLHNVSATSSDLIARVTLRTTGSAARTLAQPTGPVRFLVGLRSPHGEEEGANELPDPVLDSTADWIELYNNGTAPADLTGWSLTDNAARPRKWNFPAGTSIPAAGHLVVLATEIPLGPADGTSYLHAGFKLGAGGEYLGLVDAAGAVVDALEPAYPPQTPRHAYGRDATGAFVYFARATPGMANPETGFTEVLTAPAFSPSGGFHSGPLALALAAEGGASIRYTLDGSTPGADHGTLYSGSLTLTANTTVRAVALRDGAAPSPVATHTYLLNQSAVRRALPAFSLGGDAAAAFYGPNQPGGPAEGVGILAIKGGRYVAAETSDTWESNGDPAAYNMALQRGRAVERQASLEVFPVTGAALRTDFGLRLACSDWSRPRMRFTNAVGSLFDPWSGTQKPSFNLYFRGDFGARPLEYPLVPDSPHGAYEDLRLRAGKNDMVDPFIKDEFMRRLCRAMGQPAVLGTFATVYINGVFKGYYNACERVRDQFMRQQHDSSADWDIRLVNDIEAGDGIAWARMMAFMQAADLADPATYALVHEHLDVDNLIDYLLVNTYAATWDWPLNNWGAARERTAAGRWRFYMWDAEGAFGIYGWRTPGQHDSFLGDADGDGVPDTEHNNHPLDIGAEARTTSWKSLPALYTLLRASPEFRLRWADRVQKHFFHAGALTPEAMDGLWVSLRDAAAPIIRETTGQTISESIRNDWLLSPVRRDTLFAQMTRYGLWLNVRAPEFSQHGGEVDAGSAIVISNPNGTGEIYYTLDGSDPRAPGGAAVGSAYTAPPTITHTLVLKARVRSADGTWSPLQEAAFTTEDLSRLLVTELMYNPQGGDGYEFIELKNVGTGAAYLQDAAFDEGITYTFGADAVIPAGSHLVLARTPATFALRYPHVIVPPTGYTGKLANEGERVTLRAADGRVLASVAYGSTAPWPTTPGGGGYSLVPVDPDNNAAPDAPTSWRASTEVHGSPGRDDPLPEATAFTAQPAAWKAGNGQDTTVSVVVTGIPAPSLRWQISRDGGATWADISDDAVFTGADTATLHIADAGADLSGAQFRCVAGNGVGSTVTSAAGTLTIVPPSRLSNYSARGHVLTGDGLVIAGMVIRGPDPARMLIRAVGPRLHDLGVNHPLADPRLDVHHHVNGSTVVVASSDDWTAANDPEALRTAFAAVGAFDFGAEDTQSSAIIVELAPGTYTTHAYGSTLAGPVGMGIVLAEVYDLSESRNTLANLSARGFVGTDEQVLIPGFVVEGEAPQAYLIRAIGPGLEQFHVDGLLSDPRLRIVRMHHGDVATNDDWDSGSSGAATAAAAATVGAFPLAPGSRDAAALVALEPGIYTVVVSGAEGETGVVLVEVYAVP